MKLNKKKFNEYFNNRVAILVPYFGNLPWYFEYFIDSCAKNSEFHFYLILDTPVNYKTLPKNIFVFYKTLGEFKEIISRKLSLNISFSYPYKLCDFKPAYGIIFSEILNGYEFWGISDIDIIFGNIKSFITPEILNNFDVLSVRQDYITGFFSLYRNCFEINNLFMESKDHKIVFQSEGYTGFDECSLLCQPLSEGENLNNLFAEIESMTHIVLRLVKEKKIRAYFDLHIVESTPGKLQWNNGRLTYKDEYEILLYHMVSFKVHPLLQIPDWKIIPENYFIHEFNFSIK